MRDYASEEYWSKRYSQHPRHYDWYELELPDVGQEETSVLLGSVLELGCGTSSVGASLASLPQVSSVTCLDFSPVVVAAMQLRYARFPPHLLSFVCADVRQLPFADASFDSAFEKGLFDAVFTGPREEAVRCMAETHRVLRSGARLVSISHSPLEEMRPEFGRFFSIESVRTLRPADSKYATFVCVLQRLEVVVAPAAPPNAAVVKCPDSSDTESDVPNALLEPGRARTNHGWTPT